MKIPKEDFPVLVSIVNIRPFITSVAESIWAFKKQHLEVACCIGFMGSGSLLKEGPLHLEK